MDKKFIIATITGAIVFFLLGWLIHGMMLMDYYSNNSTTYEGLIRNPPLLIGLFLGGLCWAALLAYIFTRFANVNTFSRGFTIALIIGLLATASHNLFIYSSMYLYKASLMAVDIVVNALMHGIIGGVMGWAIGMTDRTKTATT